VCHHGMTQTLVRQVQTWHDRVVVFDHVPAELCSQCGETRFAGPIVDKLNSLLWSMAPATRTIQAPVYDLALA
jgi:YgiT-type zinc finger domain-containing protein